MDLRERGYFGNKWFSLRHVLLAFYNTVMKKHTSLSNKAFAVHWPTAGVPMPLLCAGDHIQNRSKFGIINFGA
jgi:hypothetical protein